MSAAINGLRTRHDRACGRRRPPTAEPRCRAPFAPWERPPLPWSRLEPSYRPRKFSQLRRPNGRKIRRLVVRLIVVMPLQVEIVKRRLSTTLTLFWRVFAAGWVIYFLLVGVYGMWKWLTVPNGSDAPFSGGKLVGFIIFGLASSMFVHLMAGSLKSVFIAGDKLLVSNYLKEIEIPLSQVEYVDGPDWSSLRRITLALREPSEFGEEIIFAPGFFAAGRVGRGLRNRIENASAA